MRSRVCQHEQPHHTSSQPHLTPCIFVPAKFYLPPSCLAFRFNAPCWQKAWMHEYRQTNAAPTTSSNVAPVAGNTYDRAQNLLVLSDCPRLQRGREGGRGLLPSLPPTARASFSAAFGASLSARLFLPQCSGPELHPSPVQSSEPTLNT